MPNVKWRVDSEELFRAYYDATVRDAHRYASRLTGDRSRAEDLVQDVYLELLRHARAGTVVEVSLGWLLVAVRHRFLDAIRGQEREDRRLRLAWSRPDDEAVGPVDQNAGALDGFGLSDRERAALTLRYVDDLPVAAVARELGTTVRATESLLARARARARSEARDA
jgi:RNA polymerase sigma-70 factor (ECF subfamily)